MGQTHDAFHVVVHGLDEAGAALGIFILGAGAFGGAGFPVGEPAAAGGGLADAVLMEKTDVEPNRGIESAVLVEAEPGQFIVKQLAAGLVEIAVAHAPIRQRAADAVDELADGGFAFAGVLLAVKILGDDHLGGQFGPGLGRLDVILPEDDLAGVVGDFGRAPVPFDLVEGFDVGVAENPFEGKGLAGRGRAASGGGIGAREALHFDG